MVYRLTFQNPQISGILKVVSVVVVWSPIEVEGRLIVLVVGIIMSYPMSEQLEFDEDESESDAKESDDNDDTYIDICINFYFVKSTSIDTQYNDLSLIALPRN